MTHNCLYIAKFLSYYGFPFYICLLLQKTEAQRLHELQALHLRTSKSMVKSSR